MFNLINSLYKFYFLNKITIHTIGDSHAQIPWEKINFPHLQLNINNLGAKLMYRVGIEIDLIKLTKFNISNGDIVIFCFGEIDCRCHVWRYKDSDYKTIINSLVDNYFHAIINNTSIFPNLTICIYNIVPPIRKEQHKHNELIELPFSGSNRTRKTYVNYMNKMLKNKCNEHGYLFFDIYDQYCDEEGYLDFNLSDKNVHIGNPKYIISFIKSYLMKNKIL